MKTVLFDVNVVLDVLLDQKPHAEASAAAFAAIETGAAKGLLAAHAVTTIHYLIRREMTPARAKRIISAILRVFGIAAVDATVIREALELQCPDFEDAVTAAAAHLARCDYIVTGDVKGFNGSLVSSFTPEEILPLLVTDAGRT